MVVNASILDCDISAPSRLFSKARISQHRRVKINASGLNRSLRQWQWLGYLERALLTLLKNNEQINVEFTASRVAI
jgi:hypothetical protein